MENLNRQYAGAAGLLPSGLRESAAKLPPQLQLRAEELRLRVGYPPSVLLAEGELPLAPSPVSAAELESVVEIATKASVHTVRDTLREGFINAAGGYRLGLCGNATTNDSGAVKGFRAISSIAIRIPREFSGFADKIALHDNGEIASTLIIAPPGAGKTTLLRDLVRLCSDGCRPLDVPPQRVGLCDERGEVAAVVNGAASFAVGRHTDILTAAPKSRAALMLVRTMNPEILALDEITAPEDIRAIEYAANCGVRLFATVHAASADELYRKPLYIKMLELQVFQQAVVLKKRDGKREYEVIDL